MDMYLKEIQNNSTLSLKSRKELWLKIGQIDNESIKLTDARLKRYELAKRIIEYAYNQKGNLCSINIDEIYILGNEYINNQVSYENFMEKIKFYSNELVKAMNNDNLIDACFISAFVNLLMLLLRDENLIKITSVDTTDDELDPEIWDCAYSISLIISNGGKYSEDYSSENEKKFWEYYIRVIESLL